MTTHPAGETTIFLDRLSGPAGTRVGVSGEGFAPGESITIVFSAQECARTRADGSGGFSRVICRVPPDWPFRGPYQITANGGSSIRWVDAQFRVT